MSEYNQDKETIAAVVDHLNEHASEALAGSLISDGTEGAHPESRRPRSRRTSPLGTTRSPSTMCPRGARAESHRGTRDIDD